MKCKVYIISAMMGVFLLPSAAHAAASFSGTLTGWSLFSTDGKDSPFYGLRYLPEVKADSMIFSGVKWDLDIAGNLLWTYEYTGTGILRTEQGAFYRLFMRVASEKSELRIGLQQLNFGPGKILRPLQWFDQIDPKDPTQFTLGVKGALYRQYFSNNANLWVWSLLDNTDPVGPLPMVAQSGKAEWGGRLQVPLWGGEVGLSTHQRRVKINSPTKISNVELALSLPTADEQRFGLDGVWDIGVGAWFEASQARWTSESRQTDELLMVTLGSDYTFSIGSGLYLSTETMYVKASAGATLASDSPRWFAALGPTYNMSLLDQIRLMSIHSLQGSGSNTYVDWQRKYDNLLLAVGVFHNEIDFDMGMKMQASPLAAKNGVKLLVQYNH